MTPSPGRRRLPARALLVVLVVGAAGAVAVWTMTRGPAPTPRIAGSENAPAGMVRVAAGPFLQGCPTPDSKICQDTERPGRTVTLDGFFIDRLETTVAEYDGCVKAGKCPDLEKAQKNDQAVTFCNRGKPGREKHPLNCVHWAAASDYCRSVGKRLPTEAEWEKAARGPDGRIYPWGNEPSCKRAAVGGRECRVTDLSLIGTSPGGSRPAGASPYGALDMLGNVAEWTDDVFEPQYYRTGPLQNPRGGSREGLAEAAAQTPNRGYVSGTIDVGKTARIVTVAVRGGSWRDNVGADYGTFVFSRPLGNDPTVQLDTVGFRCARSLGPNE
jgi:formylglycine-generating enzyme required for sulfatase activity